MISQRTVLQSENERAATAAWTQRAAPSAPCAAPSAHLVGICGSGMKALAEMLNGLGWSITGSDLQPHHPAIPMMRRKGLHVHSGHHSRFLSPDVDVLVYSPAIGIANPERQLASRLGIPQKSYSQMLGELMVDRTGVSIAGTHGKSTTTAMTATILSDAGLAPSVVVGAELCGREASGWAGAGELFVVESCEYQRSFLDLYPRYATILGIEPDHFDCYRDLSVAQAAFSEFAARIPSDGALIVRADCPASRAVADLASAKVETFSVRGPADWWAADQRCTASGVRFRVFYRGQYFTEVCLPLAGQHNVSNALAAIALSYHVGASPRDVRESLRDFRGIRRRFEEIGWWRGVTLIDDYAHHPTAVRVTLKAAREKFGDRRIWCVFQPHQISRTRALMDEFACSFTDADQVLLVPICTAREPHTELAEATVSKLESRIAQCGRPTRLIPSLDLLIATLEDETRPGDVLITMGAGDINRVQHEFTRRLQRNHSA